MSRPVIALVGDPSQKVTAHRAIPLALEKARLRTGADVSWEWVATRAIADAPRDLGGYAAAWFVPATPYENTAGALGAIRWAREAGRPVLGTCGGFQHMIIEYARNVAGIADADTSETNPQGSALVVSALSCSMVEKSDEVRLAPGSRLAAAFGRLASSEGYRCNYGPDPLYRAVLEKAGLVYTAWGPAGEVRGGEVPSLPFYMGVLFQPERSALKGEPHPLVEAFVRAAAA
jgi:CTP synthase